MKLNNNIIINMIKNLKNYKNIENFKSFLLNLILFTTSGVLDILRSLLSLKFLLRFLTIRFLILIFICFTLKESIYIYFVLTSILISVVNVTSVYRKYTKLFYSISLKILPYLLYIYVLGLLIFSIMLFLVLASLNLIDHWTTDYLVYLINVSPTFIFIFILDWNFLWLDSLLSASSSHTSKNPFDESLVFINNYPGQGPNGPNGPGGFGGPGGPAGPGGPGGPGGPFDPNNTSFFTWQKDSTDKSLIKDRHAKMGFDTTRVMSNQERNANRASVLMETNGNDLNPTFTAQEREFINQIENLENELENLTRKRRNAQSGLNKLNHIDQNRLNERTLNANPDLTLNQEEKLAVSEASEGYQLPNRGIWQNAFVGGEDKVERCIQNAGYSREDLANLRRRIQQGDLWIQSSTRYADGYNIANYKKGDRRGMIDILNHGIHKLDTRTISVTQRVGDINFRLAQYRFNWPHNR